MSLLSEHLPLISLIIGVAFLLFINIKLKINSILALIFSAIIVGLINGMKPMTILDTVKDGLGSTLGSLALIIGFGAVLGKIMVDSGAAQRIASTLISKFGVKNVQWALIIIGAVF
ncbi:gluconate permease, partial [Staphylococcus cohnii]